MTRQKRKEKEERERKHKMYEGQKTKHLMGLICQTPVRVSAMRTRGAGGGRWRREHNSWFQVTEAS